MGIINYGIGWDGITQLFEFMRIPLSIFAKETICGKKTNTDARIPDFHSINEKIPMIHMCTEMCVYEISILFFRWR